MPVSSTSVHTAPLRFEGHEKARKKMLSRGSIRRTFSLRAAALHSSAISQSCQSETAREQGKARESDENERALVGKSDKQPRTRNVNPPDNLIVLVSATRGEKSRYGEGAANCNGKYDPGAKFMGDFGGKFDFF